MFWKNNTLGFFLKREERGENDEVFTVLTKDFGKIELLGKSIRKIKSKLRGSAETFFLSRIEFVQGRIYKTLTDAVLVQRFENLRDDLQKLEWAFSIAKILDIFLKEEKSKEIWDLTETVFKEADTSDGDGDILKMLYCFFIWNFLDFLGYGIHLYHCVLCEEKLKPESFLFSPSLGGIVCESCAKKERNKETIFSEVVIRVNVRTVKILRVIRKNKWEVVRMVKMTQDDIRNLERITNLYLNFWEEELQKDSSKY